MPGKSVGSSEPYIYIKWPDSRVKGFRLCFMRSRKTFFPLYDTHLNSLLIKHTYTHTALKYCRRPFLVSTAVRNVSLLLYVYYIILIKGKTLIFFSSFEPTTAKGSRPVAAIVYNTHTYI